MYICPFELCVAFCEPKTGLKRYPPLAVYRDIHYCSNVVGCLSSVIEVPVTFFASTNQFVCFG